MSENSLQIIKEQELLGKNFIIYGNVENPLFVAKDIAEWLEYDSDSTNKLVAVVEDNEKLTGTIFRAGQNRLVTLLTEDGLYEVLMQSRKPIAKQFKREVKSILKQIRAHGGYLTPAKIEEALLNPDTIIRLATDLKVEQEKRRSLESTVTEMTPKTLFADSVSASKDCILIGSMAKILKQNGVETGEKRFYQWLRDNGYLCSFGKRYNHPSQMSMELGLFRVKESTVAQPNGEIIVRQTTLVTGKGQNYFINKLKSPVA